MSSMSRLVRGYLFGCLLGAAVLSGTAPVGAVEGYGAVTRGALSCPGGHTDYVVTSLADDGSPGTLRDAIHVGTWDAADIDAKSCRLVRFEVGGTITLTADLFLRSSYVTLDGCSAPAPGITITQPTGPYHGLGIEGTRQQAHDIVIRCIRFEGVHDEPGHNQHVVGDAILSVDLGCTATDATIYRGTVTAFVPDWKRGALPLTTLNDDVTPPFPLPVARPGSARDDLTAAAALVVYRVLGPEAADAGNVLRLSREAGGVFIRF